jgi:cytochrome c553
MQPPVNRLALTIVLSFVLLGTSSKQAASEETLSADDVAFFENKIRPVLVKHCYECHAADSEELGGKLLLDSRDGILQGGEAGPAVIQGKPDESLIIQALRYDGLEMPPDQPLPESVINDFVSWVKRGAPDPRSGVQKEQPSSDTDVLWSLQPIIDPLVPDTQDQTWPRDPLDRFVLAQIEAAELSPTRDADARTLVRRLYYDLIGLPPTIEIIEAFASAYASDRAKAVEQLVDSLLDSPQFGERWGRHWLDVARYAESNGNDGLGRNPTFPHAWRYRDYVIAAFNSDMPYDQFLAEQIAGDLLPSDSPEQRDRQLIATGFLALGAKPAKAMNNDFDMDVVADQIDVISRGVMGLTVACARCHDHKFDPIPTRDYYALAGMFTSTETMWGVAAHEGLTAPVTDLHVLKAAPKVVPPEDFVETVLVLESNTGEPKAIPKSKWPLGTPLAMGVRDRDKLADCKVNIKGDSN